MAKPLKEAEYPAHTYSRGASLLCDVAHIFGITVSERQAEQWRLTFLAMHELDTILDSSESYAARSAHYDGMVEVITGGSHFGCNGCYACELADHMSGLETGTKQRFQGTTEYIKRVGEIRRTTTEVRQLGQLSLREGKMSAELLELPGGTQPVRGFNAWLANVGMCGAVIDAAFDLPADYEAGLTQVRPSQRNRLSLAAYGVPYAARAARPFNLSLAHAFSEAFVAVGKDSSKDILRQAA